MTFSKEDNTEKPDTHQSSRLRSEQQGWDGVRRDVVKEQANRTNQKLWVEVSPTFLYTEPLHVHWLRTESTNLLLAAKTQF